MAQGRKASGNHRCTGTDSGAERDFETTGFLARAYNNIEEYAKAAELLESVREEGAEDERWNFRMGYAQYFLNNYREALDISARQGNLIRKMNTP